MPKRAAKKKSPPRIKARPGAGLEKALAKQKKEDLAKSGLPAEEIRAWRREMARKDRVGFICRKELDALEKRFQD